MKRLKLAIALGLALFCTSHSLWAQEPQSGQNPTEGQPSGEHHRGPPPEAYSACEGKTAGTAASFVTTGGRPSTVRVRPTATAS